MASRCLVVKGLILAMVCFMVGCGNGVASTSVASSTKGTTPEFSLPDIPVTITGIENRSQYLVEHYWNNFDFKDSTTFGNDSIMSIALGGYVQVLTMTSTEVAQQSIDHTLSSALNYGYNTFERLTSKLEDYLYDPNSPMRNEEMYICVLRYTTQKAKLDDIYKIRSRKQLDMALKNRAGHTATNFEYETRDGKTSTLKAAQTDYTILFFNTPDCEDCRRVKKYIGSSSLLGEMVKAKGLTILGVYTERDIALWRKARYPSIIVNGADIDGKILEKSLYDLKALPTLYLLDGNKKVILKDRSIEEIEAYLEAKASR